MNKRKLTSALNEQQEQETVQEKPQEAPTEVLRESEGNSAITVQEVTERLKEQYEEKRRRPTVEDTHTRSTFLFRNDLHKRLDRLARNKRGFKTMFINEAIEALLNEWEK